MVNWNRDIKFKAFDVFNERIKEFESKHGWIDYLIAPVLVTIIVLAVLWMKGVYPFGVNTVAYYDLPHNFVPIYTYFWDVLHGDAGLYLNWYNGLGVSMADLDGAFLFFPTNLLLLLSSRDGIIYFMSLFLLFKMALSAMSMSFYCKTNSFHPVFIISAGMLYSCSGFVLQYYTNPFFLDLVILFPLLVWSLERMINEQKYFAYTILIFFIFLTYSQLVISVLIYLIIKGYVLLKNIQNENRGKIVRVFFLTTMVSLLLSCFNFIPMIVQLLQSTRAELSETFNYRDEMRNILCLLRVHKQFMIYGSEVALSVIIIILCRGKEIISKYFYNLIIIAILILPILHEGIDLLWHGGSYKHFPLRFGYMISFECLVLVGKYIKHEKNETIKTVSGIAKILGIAFIPFESYVLFDYIKSFLQEGITNLSIYHGYELILITLVFSYLCILLTEEKVVKYYSLIVLTIIQCSLGCYGFIAPEIAFATDSKILTVLNSINLKKEFDTIGDCSIDSRIKTIPLEYCDNESIIVKHPNISAWLNGLNTDTENELKSKLGYHGTPSTVSDSGGTSFSDAILSVHRLGGSYNPDPHLYESTKERNIYNLKYTLPFGIVIGNLNETYENELLDYHNDLFAYFSDIHDHLLIDICDADNCVTLTRGVSTEEERYIEKKYFDINGVTVSNDEKNAIASSDSVNNSIYEYSINMSIETEKSVYFVCDSGFDGELKLLLDENPVIVDSVSNADSMRFIYPNQYINGILSLGTYKDETVNLKIYTKNENLAHVKIGLLDLSVLEEGIKKIKANQDLNIQFGKNGMHVTGKAYKTGRLFLPVGYSDNWHAKANGKVIPVRPCFNNAFVSVDVTEGDVDIVFTYRPKGLIIGIVLSAVGIILGICFLIFDKKGGLNGKPRQIADMIFLYGYYTVFAVLIIFLYIIPIYIKMAL